MAKINHKKISIVLIIMALIISMLPIDSWQGNAYAADNSITTGRVTSTDGVNVRSKASSNGQRVGGLSYNSSFTIKEIKFTSKSSMLKKYIWYMIETSSMTGYVRSDFAAITHGTQFTGVATGNVNMRKGAGLDFARITTIKKGATVKVVANGVAADGSKWYKIYDGKNYGYVSAKYVTKDTNADSGIIEEPTTSPSQEAKTTGKVTISSGVNVRTRASSASTSAGTLSYNSSFTIKEIKFNSKTSMLKKYVWYKIETSSVTGYVRSDYAAITHGTQFMGVATGNVNMRKGAGLDFARITTIKKGATVKVVANGVAADGSKWYKIYDGKNYGYVSAKYVTKDTNADSGIIEEPTTSPSQEAKTTGKVTLSSGVDVRTRASSASTSAGTLPYNSSFTIKEIKFNSKTSMLKKYVWYKIETSSVTGYVRSDYAAITHGTLFTGVATGNVNMRKGAGLDYTRITTIKKGATVKVVANGVAADGSKWYKIYDGKNYGYVSGSYVSSDSFNDQLIQEGFPASYRTELLKLHSKYPNWKFKAKPVGYSWSQAFAKQCSNTGANTIPSSYGDSWKLDNRPSDGAGWVRASKKTVAYYMDPRNWMEADSIFMFEAQEYDSAIHKEDSVKKLLSPTALPSSASSYYMEAARTHNINPLYLAAKTQLELGPYSFMVDGHSFTYGATDGYCSADYIQSPISPTATGKTTGDDINVREEPTTSSRIITTVPKSGTSFEIDEAKLTSKSSMAEENVWYKIKTSSGEVGYIRSDLVSITYGKAIQSITTDSVNLRTGAGTGFSTMSTISKNASVKILLTVVAADGSKWYKLDDGNSRTFSNCYNVFNIGASDSADGSAATKGLVYAAGGINKTETSYGRPWNTLKKAVLGGTQFIKTQFVDNRQYTPYYERFNVLNGLSSVGTYQYATASFYAATQGNVIYNRYKDLEVLSTSFTFEIPVYTGMPASVSPRP